MPFAVVPLGKADRWMPVVPPWPSKRGLFAAWTMGELVCAPPGWPPARACLRERGLGRVGGVLVVEAGPPCSLPGSGHARLDVGQQEAS